ncbi:hypothetical protein PBN151_3094 [Paenibacillus sp. NAIST15-1]|nr:hypothetical protein PBN151_3094 [Paenibacillus sp. NAIST15-1]
MIISSTKSATEDRQRANVSSSFLTIMHRLMLGKLIPPFEQGCRCLLVDIYFRCAEIDLTNENDSRANRSYSHGYQGGL